MPFPRKNALRDAIVASLEQELATLTAGAEASRAEATDTENRQEGKYDMRAQLAAYLAAGQGKLAAELHEAIAAYRGLALTDLPEGSPATVGALVQVRSKAETQCYFLGPARGGLELTVDGIAVIVITPAAPLGRELGGKRAGSVLSGGRTLIAVQ